MHVTRSVQTDIDSNSHRIGQFVHAYNSTAQGNIISHKLLLIKKFAMERV